MTQLFDPEPSHLKGLNFARRLVQLGHSVRVITCFPNYPGGSIYPGYEQKVWSREVVDGVEIIRLPLYPSHDRSGYRRALCYGTFAVSASTAMTLLADADVVHVYQGPASLGLPALVAQAFRKVPFVYDIQDLWPDSLETSGMLTNPAALRAVGHWCSYVYSKAARIVVLCPGMKRELVARGVADAKIDVVYNWADDSLLGSPERDLSLARDLGVEGRFVIMFAGTMGRMQGLGALLDAAAVVEPRDSRICFLLVGGGVEAGALQREAYARGLSNVKFLGRQPPEMMPRLYSVADAAFVQLTRTDLARITIPQKLQAYMAAGKPILAALEGDGARLVEQAGAGIVCSPEDSERIADCAVRLVALEKGELRRLGGSGRRFYEDRLAVERGVASIMDAYAGAVGATREA
ncbi:MAG: glycosyltransferase family 4 protein [Thermoleophilia bacterium]